MPSSDSHDYALIDQLAEEFAERFRKGERPSIQEYCDRYPHIADDLREMLPALAEVEHIKDEVQEAPKVDMPKLRQVGEYSILREVGRGGMGVVYEAEQVTLGRRVALKVLAGGKSGHGLERFKREARAAARLHHTNIVPVFGVGDHEGMPYYVMQFIQGLGIDEVLDEVKRLQAVSGTAVPPSSLSARPRRKDVSVAAVARSLVTGAFEPPPINDIAETLTQSPVGQVSNLSFQSGQIGNLSHEQPTSASGISLPGQSNVSGRKLSYWHSVAQIGLQVADALDYAHKQGILHRDIKPSNLLLDLHGVVWVTDFGLAKTDDQENLTHTGDVLGTLRYMPPEAFEGNNDARSDVYSLGLSMYELLALRPAYDERKREQLVKQVTTTDPPRLGALNKSIPRDLQTIVHKSIEKDPNHRYASAGAFAADLRRFLSDQTILARRVSPSERFTRWCRRNPTVAGLTAAVFLLMTSVTLVSSVLAMRIEKKAKEAEEAAELAKYEAKQKGLALDDAQQQRQRTQELLADQFVLRGGTLLAEGDTSGAALCFAKATILDSIDPDRTATHRVRLAAALRDAPRPRHILFPPSSVICTAVSPDNSLLATGCKDGFVRVWDMKSGALIGEPFKHPYSVTDVAFTADSRRLWTSYIRPADERTPKNDPGAVVAPSEPPWHQTLWNVQTGAKIIDGPSFVQSLTWTAKVKTDFVGFMTANDSLQLCDANTGDPIGPVIKADKPISYWSASNRAGRVLIFSHEPRTKTDDFPFGGGPVNVQVSLCDPRTGKCFLTLKGVSSTANVAFSGANDGRVVVRETNPAAVIQWYDSATGIRGPRAALGESSWDVLTVSLDGRRVIVAGSDSSSTGRSDLLPVRLFDGDSGELVGPQFSVELSSVGGFRGQTRVYSNRDATRLMMSSGPGAARLYRGDGSTVATLPGTTNTAFNQFSPDGGYLLTVSQDNTVRVWDAWTGLPVTPKLPHDGPLELHEFTPDGSHVVVATAQAVWVWPLARVESNRGFAPNSPVRGQLDLSADGRRLLEVTGVSPFAGSASARVLDTASGQVVHGPIAIPMLVYNSAALRPLVSHINADGSAVVITISPRQVKGGLDVGPKGSLPPDPTTRIFLWVCSSDQLIPLDSMDPAVGTLNPGEFSPDGKYVRVQWMDRKGQVQTRLYDAKTGGLVGPGVAITTGLPTKSGLAVSALNQVLWHPDSTMVVIRDGGPTLRLHLHDTRNGATVAEPIELEGRRPTSVAFNKLGDRLMTVQPVRVGAISGQFGNRDSTGEVRLWDPWTCQPLMPVLTGKRLGGEITNAVLNAVGDRIAVVARAGQGGGFGTGGLVVHLWDPAADRMVGPPLVHDQPVGQLKFSPNGEWLLTYNNSGQLRIWSVSAGELLHAMTTAERIVNAFFSDDSRRIVTQTVSDERAGPGGPNSFDRTQTWDARTGQQLTPSLTVPAMPFLFGPSSPNSIGWLVSRNADRFVIGQDDGSGSATIFSLTGDDRPADDLVALAELLSVRQINSAGIVQGLGSAGFRAAWDARREKFASDWAATPVDGLDWHRRNLSSEAMLRSGGFVGNFRDRVGQFLWHLERLIPAEPDEARNYIQQGRCHSSREEFAAAAAAYDRGIALDPKQPPNMYRMRANARAETGDWKGAEEDLVKLLTLPVDPGVIESLNRGSNRVPLALVHLRRGNETGYRASCTEIIKAIHDNPIGKGPTLSLLTRASWAVLLRDPVDISINDLLPSPSDLSTVVGFSTLRLEAFNFGLALRYRQGRYAEAMEQFRSPAAKPADYFFLAMTQHKVGNPEARKTLAKAIELQTQPHALPPTSNAGTNLQTITKWETRIVEDELRKEAEGMIVGKK